MRNLPTEADFALLRHRMVEDQLRARNISDDRVLQAMEKVPRHLFVPETQRWAAYDDCPLSIGLGQTISQPYMVARMTELLRLTPEDRVLEIGTGSGYQAAILAELAKEVWTVERHPELAERARKVLESLGYSNVHVVVGDGSLGYPDAAPYDAIIVTCAAPAVPEPLLQQLAIGGRMVIPVTVVFNQELRLIERLPDAEAEPAAQADAASTGSEAQPAPSQARPRYRETPILGCVFVPLVGECGYPK
ncbi:MAG: protein-L-isoaspartate(D-aspartate) O-methyltransferase [Thermoleophilia bacterium]|nr:protein-L-isoaspartate(D-aspartate) O-methyltransferase [Thermoleophilia bacterium]